jgi:acyl-CoA thioesterase
MGAKEANIGGYYRFKETAGNAEGMIGLLDAWPCPTLSTLTNHAFASTVSWTAHILQIPDNFEDWFAFTYKTVVGHDGYHTCLGHLYNKDKQLIGWTEQLIAVFE